MFQNKHNCNQCYFNDFCSSDEECEYYSPTTDEDEYISTDALIEEGRESYRAEWFEYIENNQF